MGADLYIESIYDEESGDGYFRDSYNPTSILNKLGLDWWADVRTVTEGDFLPIEETIKLREMIISRELPEAEEGKM